MALCCGGGALAEGGGDFHGPDSGPGPGLYINPDPGPVAGSGEVAPGEGGLRLEEVLLHVHAYNPTLESAREELKAAQEAYPQALSGWRPTLSAEAGIYATDIETTPGGGSGTGATTKEMAINARQPLFRGGRTVAETARAEALIRAARAEYQRTEQKIFLDTARAYLDVMRDRTILELRRGNEALLAEELEAARARHRAGEITVTDVLHGEGRLARARAEALSAQGDLEAANARFEEIIGLSAAQTLHYPALAPEIPPQLAEALDMAGESNLDIVAARHARDAADHGADAALRELFPQVFAYASYNRQYDPQPGLASEVEVETIGLRATMALYEGGTARARVRQARHAANRRAIEIGETADRVRSVLTANWKARDAAEAEIASRLEEIAALQEAREGVRAETLMGTRTVLDLLDADQELLESRTALAVARRDAALARLAVAENLGLLKPGLFGAGDIFDADAHLEKISGLFTGTDVEEPRNVKR